MRGEVREWRCCGLVISFLGVVDRLLSTYQGSLGMLTPCKRANGVRFPTASRLSSERCIPYPGSSTIIRLSSDLTQNPPGSESIDHAYPAVPT